MKSILLSISAVALPIAALISAPATQPAAQPSTTEAVTYTVDGVHSSVMFRIKHVNASWFYGRFNQVSGSITWDEAEPAKSKVSIEIAADSVDTNSADRDKHLKSPDFFSAAEFPTISFTSKSVAKKKDKLAVTGDLTLHGVTKEITIEVEPTGKSEMPRFGPRAGFEAIFEVKRSDFGVKYGLPDALGDDVRLFVALEGMKG